jgi:hypothetical protein
MGLDVEHVVIATKSVQHVNFSHLPCPVTSTKVGLLGLFDDPHLTTSRRFLGGDLHRLAHTVHRGELAFTSVQLLHLVEAFSERLVHIVLSESDGDDTLHAVEKVVLPRCGRCRWRKRTQTLGKQVVVSPTA